MPGQPRKRARKEAAKQFLEQPDAIDLICAAVRTGSLYDFCRATLVDPSKPDAFLHYGTVQEWIEADESRRKRYREALEVRKLHGNDLVMREVLDHLKIDITSAFEENGTLKPLDKIPENVRRFIAGMEVEELFDGSGKDKVHIGRVRKLKFQNKESSTNLLAKILGMVVEKHEVRDKTLEDILDESYGEKTEPATK